MVESYIKLRKDKKLKDSNNDYGLYYYHLLTEGVKNTFKVLSKLYPHLELKDGFEEFRKANKIYHYFLEFCEIENEDNNITFSIDKFKSSIIYKFINEFYQFANTIDSIEANLSSEEDGGVSSFIRDLEYLSSIPKYRILNLSKELEEYLLNNNSFHYNEFLDIVSKIRQPKKQVTKNDLRRLKVIFNGQSTQNN